MSLALQGSMSAARVNKNRGALLIESARQEREKEKKQERAKVQPCEPLLDKQARLVAPVTALHCLHIQVEVQRLSVEPAT